MKITVFTATALKRQPTSRLWKKHGSKRSKKDETATQPNSPGRGGEFYEKRVSALLVQTDPGVRQQRQIALQQQGPVRLPGRGLHGLLLPLPQMRLAQVRRGVPLRQEVALRAGGGGGRRDHKEQVCCIVGRGSEDQSISGKLCRSTESIAPTGPILRFSNNNDIYQHFNIWAELQAAVVWHSVTIEKVAVCLKNKLFFLIFNITVAGLLWSLLQRVWPFDPSQDVSA